MFTIESVARILVITKESGTIARKTGSPFVQFISREINQATSSLTFSTRNSILETRSSRLETRYSKLSRIEYRVSRLEDRGSRDCQLTFERYCSDNASAEALAQLPDLIDCSNSDDDDNASCAGELDDNADQPDDIYNAEEIVNQGLRNGRPEYLIKWLGFPASHNTWEPVEHIINKCLVTSFYKKHSQAKCFIDSDYIPNNVALLSWTESSNTIATVAALAPGHEPGISHQDESLTSLGCVLRVDSINLAATPNLTQVPILHVDIDEGLIPFSNPVPCPGSRSCTSDITHPATIASAPSPGSRCTPWLTTFPATHLWLFLLFTPTLTQTGRVNEYDA